MDFWRKEHQGLLTLDVLVEGQEVGEYEASRVYIVGLEQLGITSFIEVGETHRGPQTLQEGRQECSFGC